MARQPILQKFYVYDPNVNEGDEFGGLRVMGSDDGIHVLTQPTSAQYWLDQGLIGRAPLSQLEGGAKALLAQLTRGRSESDDEPKRVPKYSRATQSGAPEFAGKPVSVRAKLSKARSLKMARDETRRTTNKVVPEKPKAQPKQAIPPVGTSGG